MEHLRPYVSHPLLPAKPWGWRGSSMRCCGGTRLHVAHRLALATRHNRSRRHQQQLAQQGERIQNAGHSGNQYVRPRTDRRRNKCFTDTCCQSVPFATCLPRQWLMHALVQCQLSRSSSSWPPCSLQFGRTMPTRTGKQYAPSRSIHPTRRKCFAGACPRTNFSL
jgi:hypothetical protein